MDQERYVTEPNQVLNAGKYRRERYSDTNGAIYETTHYDAHGNALTRNHQLGPANRYGYDYAGGDTPGVPRAHTQPWPHATAGAAAAGAVGGVAAYEVADSYVQGNMAVEGGENGEEFILWLLIVVVVLALGPLFLGIWMVRRAEATGGSKTHGRLVLLLEVPWLAALWGWLFTGGTTAWITVAGTVFALAVWYGMTLRDEACQGHEDA